MAEATRRFGETRPGKTRPHVRELGVDGAYVLAGELARANYEDDVRSTGGVAVSAADEN